MSIAAYSAGFTGGSDTNCVNRVGFISSRNQDFLSKTSGIFKRSVRGWASWVKRYIQKVENHEKSLKNRDLLDFSG